MEPNESKNTFENNLIMVQENNCSVNLIVYDTTNFQEGNHNEFASFLYRITHKYNLLLY
mgnify:CR=1 FL=1